MSWNFFRSNPQGIKASTVPTTPAVDSTTPAVVSTICKKSVQMKISINDQGDKFLDEYKENDCNDGVLNINNVIKLDKFRKNKNAK